MLDEWNWVCSPSASFRLQKKQFHQSWQLPYLIRAFKKLWIQNPDSNTFYAASNQFSVPVWLKYRKGFKPPTVNISTNGLTRCSSHYHRLMSGGVSTGLTFSQVDLSGNSFIECLYTRQHDLFLMTEVGTWDLLTKALLTEKNHPYAFRHFALTLVYMCPNFKYLVDLLENLLFYFFTF